jgi:hypothetical protein
MVDPHKRLGALRWHIFIWTCYFPRPIRKAEEAQSLLVVERVTLSQKLVYVACESLEEACSSSLEILEHRFDRRQKRQSTSSRHLI